MNAAVTAATPTGIFYSTGTAVHFFAFSNRTHTQCLSDYSAQELLCTSTHLFLLCNANLLQFALDSLPGFASEKATANQSAFKGPQSLAGGGAAVKEETRPAGPAASFTLAGRPLKTLSVGESLVFVHSDVLEILRSGKKRLAKVLLPRRVADVFISGATVFYLLEDGAVVREKSPLETEGAVMRRFLALPESGEGVEGVSEPLEAFEGLRISGGGSLARRGGGRICAAGRRVVVSTDKTRVYRLRGESACVLEYALCRRGELCVVGGECLLLGDSVVHLGDAPYSLISPAVHADSEFKLSETGGVFKKNPIIHATVRGGVLTGVGAERVYFVSAKQEGCGTTAPAGKEEEEISEKLQAYRMGPPALNLALIEKEEERRWEGDSRLSQSGRKDAFIRLLAATRQWEGVADHYERLARDFEARETALARERSALEERAAAVSARVERLKTQAAEMQRRAGCVVRAEDLQEFKRRIGQLEELLKQEKATTACVSRLKAQRAALLSLIKR